MQLSPGRGPKSNLGQGHAIRSGRAHPPAAATLWPIIIPVYSRVFLGGAVVTAIVQTPSRGAGKG